MEVRAGKTGARSRTAGELSSDLATGCESLGALAAEWRVRGFDARDVSACERTVAGIQRLLVEVRLTQARPVR